MRTLFLSPFLLALVLFHVQTSPSTDGDSSVVVKEHKWSRSRLTLEQSNSADPGPAAAMIPANQNFERNRRNNNPGERDPNEDTIDGRSAQLEKNVQASRAPKPVDGFTYRVKFQNTSKKVVEILFWEYQFQETANPTNVVRRQFLCPVNLKPEKSKDLLTYSLSGPSGVISADTLAMKSGKLFQERV